MTTASSYLDFAHLRRHEREGVDFVILHRPGSSGILVMAPHGGGIEPGTGVIADALAGRRHAFYCFKGIKPRGNFALHISSNRFDEPLAVQMLGEAQWVLSIHGCRDEDAIVWVGGRDVRRGEAIIAGLSQAGIPAARSEHPGLRGLQPDNVCNRGRSGAGVQLEISSGLRRGLFYDLDQRPLRRQTPLFHDFVDTLRACIAGKEGHP